MQGFLFSLLLNVWDMDDIRMYSMKYFEDTEQKNRNDISQILFEEIRLFERIVNIQSGLFDGCFTISALPEYRPTPSECIMIQSYIKSTYLLFNAHRLVLQGYYGIAQSLLRQVFEFALISRYFHLKNNDGEAEKWLEECQFDIFNKILKRLEKPSKTSFFVLWKMLCGGAHATAGSCQITSDCQANRYESIAVYSVIILLLCLDSVMLDDLLKRKKPVRLKRYLGDEFVCELKLLRRERNELIRIATGLFSDEGKALVKDYKANWVFKTN